MTNQAFANATQAMELIRTKQIAKLRDARITANFKWGEFFTNRVPTDILHPQYGVTLAHLVNLVMLGERMESVRVELGNRPITITSGWRDYISNREAGGAPRSYHLIGQACDFVVKGMTPKEVQAALAPTWKGGLGYGATFTHLDIRPTKARFRYG